MVIDNGRAIAFVRCAMAAACLEFFRAQAAAEVADELPAASTITGKGRLKAKIATNAAAAMRPQHAVFKRARADALGSEQHNGGDRRLDAIEDAGHRWQIAKGQINPGQRNQDKQRRQDKQHAGR